MFSALIIKGVIFRFVPAFFEGCFIAFFMRISMPHKQAEIFFKFSAKGEKKPWQWRSESFFYGSRTGVLSRGNEYLKKFCAFLKKCLTCVNIISIMIECIRMR